MTELLALVLGAALVNNFVLVQFLGLCPFMGVSSRLDAAASMGFATTFVLTVSAGASHVIHYRLLVPLDLQYLDLIAFIVVIAALVQLTGFWVRATSPILHQVMGIYLPLITTNCAVLGVALLTVQQGLGFFQTLLYAMGAAVGFTLVLVTFAALRERLATADVPAPFAGTPIALITAGLMSLAFIGFTGLAS